MNAADLPEGSIIGTRNSAIYRVVDGIGAVWHSTSGNRWHDRDISEKLAQGAQVLRVGYGEGQ